MARFRCVTSAMQMSWLRLDEAVDKLYRSAPFLGDTDRVEHLFGLYEELMTPLIAGTEPHRRRRSRR
jgi:MmeI, C-terminal domain